MNRPVLLVAVLLASLTAACGNGGTIGIAPLPPPPTGNFSNASLKGQYSFLMSGTELCSGSSSFFTRAGSFAADGSGHITGGLEDINVCTGVFTLQFNNSTYSITADGRGTLSLTNSSGTTNYSITLSSTTQGVIVQTDVNSTASGSFQRQNAAAFSNPAIVRTTFMRSPPWLLQVPRRGARARDARPGSPPCASRPSPSRRGRSARSARSRGRSSRASAARVLPPAPRA